MHTQFNQTSAQESKSIEPIKPMCHLVCLHAHGEFEHLNGMHFTCV